MAAARKGREIMDLEEMTLFQLLDKINTAGFLLGIPAGISAAARELKERAGVVFMNGDTETAVVLRDAAGLLEDLAAKRDRNYRTSPEGQKMKTAVIAEVERRQTAVKENGHEG